MFISVLIICIISLLDSSIAGYCDMDSNHVLCGKKEFHARCGDAAQIQGPKIPDEEKVKLLELHNKYRDEVAAGKAVAHEGSKFPTAANMEELVWDEELTSVAESAIKECLFEHTCSTCRSVDRFSVGENIYMGISSDQLFKQPWNKVVFSWTVEEAKNYDVNDVDKLSTDANKFGTSFSDFGHLTQVAWALTKRIGCARVAFKNKEGMNEAHSFCNYGPSGNMLDSEVYKRGTPCSMCEGGRGCSATYPNLCSASDRKDEPPPKTVDPDPSSKTKISASAVLIAVGSLLSGLLF